MLNGLIWDHTCNYMRRSWDTIKFRSSAGNELSSKQQVNVVSIFGDDYSQRLEIVVKLLTTHSYPIILWTWNQRTYVCAGVMWLFFNCISYDNDRNVQDYLQHYSWLKNSSMKRVTEIYEAERNSVALYRPIIMLETFCAYFRTVQLANEHIMKTYKHNL